MAKDKRGFARMSEEERQEAARKGGSMVPKERRSFSQDRELAQAAGRKGGTSVPKENRSFSRNRELAQAAGRKGGLVSVERRLAKQQQEGEKCDI
jgi:general stress protein YciG